MKATIKPLTQRPAWKALAAHHKQIQKLHLRKLFADDPKRGQRLTAEAAGLFLDYLQEPHHRPNPQAAAATGQGIRLARENGRDVQWRKNQHHGKPRRAARRVARAERRNHSRGRKKCRAGSPRRARQDGGVFQSRPQRRMEGPYRQTHQERHQHRHRRFRPWSGDGLRGAQTLQRPQPDVPLRLERGRD